MSPRQCLYKKIQRFLIKSIIQKLLSLILILLFVHDVNVKVEFKPQLRILNKTFPKQTDKNFQNDPVKTTTQKANKAV